MDVEPQSVVAIVAIVASFLTTWINLRSNLQKSREERLWGRKAEVYEETVAYCIDGMQERHEWATGHRQDPFDVDPPDSEEVIPTLNRLLIYASRPVRAAVVQYGKAERDWRRAYHDWRIAEDAQQADEPELKRKVRAAGEVADAVALLVVELIKRELTTGAPPKRRWFKRLRYVGTADESEDPSARLERGSEAE